VCAYILTYHSCTHACMHAGAPPLGMRSQSGHTSNSKSTPPYFQKQMKIFLPLRQKQKLLLSVRGFLRLFVRVTLEDNDPQLQLTPARLQTTSRYTLCGTDTCLLYRVVRLTELLSSTVSLKEHTFLISLFSHLSLECLPTSSTLCACLRNTLF
jgi:hypothetical protein